MRLLNRQSTFVRRELFNTGDLCTGGRGLTRQLASENTEASGLE
jgi:hypothetical protein